MLKVVVLAILTHTNLKSCPVKCLCRQITENEKKILNTILDSSSFSEVKALEILDQLEDKKWDLQRIRRYWNNNRISETYIVGSANKGLNDEIYSAGYYDNNKS
ncbi:5008_t:CDS:2 [Dentiscutata erythropus]|uniref:5008_t:CDS:1 n=1 Tax=Dentiscutata erythropus TaxID=1348616 RepID=A0A9N8ZTX1_9GLOM|nr:5008_t:CDS:2 [Dentiscutata erythropus]